MSPETTGSAGADQGPASAAREIFRGVVHPWWHDQFGHMNVRWYAHLFDDAAFHLWPEFGVSQQQLQAGHGVHTVTGRATTTFVRELKAGDLVVIEAALIRLGGRSITFQMTMRHRDTGAVHATCEIVEVMFDPVTRRSAPLPDPLRARLEPLLATTSSAS